MKMIHHVFAQPRSALRLALSFLCACMLVSAPALRAEVQTSMIDVGGRRIAFHVTPGRTPILVLDAGGGLDSSYWADIVPELARRTGSEIITYDRAGSGESSELTPPFRMQDAVDDLEGGLRQLGATRDLILVPHSMAGEIATYFARRHPGWIAGAVLVDADVPDFFSKGETERQYRQIQPQVAAMLRANPSKQMRALAAYADAFVPISLAFHKVTWPARIPCAVIVSEKTPFANKTDAQLWRQAHAVFVRRASNRTLIVAKGSSHDVAHDRPDVIVGAVVEMIKALRR